MAKTFYVSPGRSYTVTATEGTTITYPGVTKPAATVGSTGSVTFNCTATEIVVSDDNAKIAQNFNNAGAAVAGAGGESGSTEGVALLEGGNSFSGDQSITGNVTIKGSLVVTDDVDSPMEGVYNGAEVIQTADTTIIPQAGKYYKYTGTGDTITVTAPILNGYITISYLETVSPVELQGVTWSPAKPSLTGAGPFVYTLVCAESGSVLASVMNYSVATAEAIQKVVPIAWSEGALATVSDTGAAFQELAIGKSARTSGVAGTAVGSFAETKSNHGTAFGYYSKSKKNYSVALGYSAQSNETYSVSVGCSSKANETLSIALGYYSESNSPYALTIGSVFTEATPDGDVTNYCKTQGTGSITIGAGANTLNNGDTESSNSVTIGCKASNSGADSVVIGAQASGNFAGGIVIGAGATVNNITASVAIGYKASSLAGTNIAAGANSYAGGSGAVAYGNNSRANGNYSTAIGGYSAVSSTGTCIGSWSSATSGGTAVGCRAKVLAERSTAIGNEAAVNDAGATVIRSTASGGTYTQLYFSGANTPLANTYEGGEAMMGYVVRDSAGNIMTDAEGNAMVGTQKLSVLFPNNRGENAFTPAMLGLDDEWTPKPMFRPSDLDMPQEEPTEPEEYQPLPVYPIVEPEMPSELPSEES